jgi:hypothetical protein
MSPVTPNLVPQFDVTVYIVLDDFGEAGRAYRETDEEDARFEPIVDDLMTGQFNNPVRVIAFSTGEGWSRDVSEDVAGELLKRLRKRVRRSPTLHVALSSFTSAKRKCCALASRTEASTRRSGPSSSPGRGAADRCQFCEAAGADSTMPNWPVLRRATQWYSRPSIVATVSNHRCDSADKDNKGHKYPTNAVDLRFALRITRLVQVGHRDLRRYKGGRL